MLLMSNQVIFAAAGNGKTYSLCAKAKAAISTGTKYVLLISYTNEGIRALEKEYKKQNCGVLDERIIIKSWYSFLLSEFIKPYQCSLRLNKKFTKKRLRLLFRKILFHLLPSMLQKKYRRGLIKPICNIF